MSQLTFDGTIDDKGSLKNSPKIEEPIEKESWYKGRVLSYSSVNTYDTCPQKWKFRYIDKIPEKPRSYFSFGKSVHSGLEFLFSQIPATTPSLSEVLDHYKSIWIREGYETQAQEKWFYQEGERILKGFYSKHQKDFKDVFQVEYKFNFSMDGVPLTGFIDRIDLTPNGKLKILDYKTGRSFDKSRVRDESQLTLYQIAAQELLGKEVEEVGLYHLNSLTLMYVPAHSGSHQNKVRELVGKSARGIHEKKFDPAPDVNGHCRWCDYIQICPAFTKQGVPRTLNSAAQDPITEAVDRYGHLDRKIEEMSGQKEELRKTLLAHFNKSQGKVLEGRDYSVRFIAAGQEGSPSLESRPKKKV